jgi:hypothetical protein
VIPSKTALEIGPASSGRLETIHAAVFTLGVFTGLAGLCFAKPALLIFAGPCWVLSGALAWFGNELAFRGVVGRIVSASLGRVRMASLRLRALTRLVIGVLLTVWGISQLIRSHEQRGPTLPGLARPTAEPAAPTFQRCSLPISAG